MTKETRPAAHLVNWHCLLVFMGFLLNSKLNLESVSPVLSLKCARSAREAGRTPCPTVLGRSTWPGDVGQIGRFAAVPTVSATGGEDISSQVTSQILHAGNDILTCWLTHLIVSWRLYLLQTSCDHPVFIIWGAANTA